MGIYYIVGALSDEGASFFMGVFWIGDWSRMRLGGRNRLIHFIRGDDCARQHLRFMRLGK